MKSSKTSSRPLSGFEILVLIHVGVFLVATTWAFGGNADFVRTPLALWGSLGALITIAASIGGRRSTRISLRPFRWLWPFALFNALVLASTLTPLLLELKSATGAVLSILPVPAWKPAAAEPDTALRGLWLFDAIYLSCFNLALIVRRRRALRGLMLIAAGNALLLSIFGTVQKLMGATGLYFGRVKSPQDYFFSTFVYDNHWGAFAVLMAAIALALVRYHSQRADGRGFFHTPAFGGLVAVLVLAVTVPLSGSRSCTLLLAVLLLGAFFGWLARLARQRREYGESVGVPLVAGGAAIVLGIAGVWFLAGNVISKRVAKTEEQIASMEQRDDVHGRIPLYRDTVRMAGARPWFGWGMGSFPRVFYIYNTQEPNPLDHLPIYYHDAHSDWLQAAAEHGLVGAALLALCALVPLRGLRRSDLKGPLTLYPLAGCGLILLYAWVEFPFGNVAVVLSWWICFFAAVRHAQLGSSSIQGERSLKPAG